VKFEAWNIHIVDFQARLERRQAHSKTVIVIRLNSSDTSRLVELPQSFVAK
jgi:hypothetical protein